MTGIRRSSGAPLRDRLLPLLVTVLALGSLFMRYCGLASPSPC